MIDDNLLINGSYNWTYFAETKNRENVLVIAEENETIAAFKNEFNKLKLPNRILKIVRFTKFQSEQYDTFSSKEYLVGDILIEARLTKRIDIIKEALELAPNNIDVQATARDFNLIKKRKVTVTIGAGLKDNDFMEVIPKGTVLPLKVVKDIFTIKSEQTDCGIPLYYGNNSNANSNTPLHQLL